MKLHPSITTDRILRAVEDQMFGLENPGFCIACGEDAEGCEPDARKYKCESCGEKAVYGAQELMLRTVA
jgi:DNA-directed RNA polymerase subunit RPC12/RpoP